MPKLTGTASPRVHVTIGLASLTTGARILNTVIPIDKSSAQGSVLSDFSAMNFFINLLFKKYMEESHNLNTDYW